MVPRLCSTFGGTSLMWCIISCLNRVKPSQGIGIERIWCVWAELWRKKGHSTKRDTTKLSSSMTMHRHMSQDRSRHTWERWNERSYPTRRTLQTLLLPTTICFEWWHTACLTGSSAFPLLWRSQKMDRFVVRLKIHIVFSRWYRTIARKMEKSSG